MCNLSEIILEKGIEIGRTEGRMEGKNQTLCELVQQGLLSIHDAAEDMGVDVKTFIGRAMQQGYRF